VSPSFISKLREWFCATIQPSITGFYPKDGETLAKRQGELLRGRVSRSLDIAIDSSHSQSCIVNRKAAAGQIVSNVTEPVWSSLLPVSKRTQYLLHWFIAETLPPDLEASIGPPPQSREYQQPPPYPSNLRLVNRIAAESEGYEPTRYSNTGVDSDEALYTSFLLPVKEAITKMGRSSMAEVISIGWERIQARLETEKAEAVQKAEF